MATEIITPAPTNASLMTVIERLASNSNVDIDKIQRLLEMQERWELNRDKASLRHAVAEFKKNPPAIIKDRKAVMEKDGRKLYEYQYSDLENVTSSVESGLANYGVTFAWPQREEGGQIVINCEMRYGMYEERGIEMSAAPDTSGGKNSIQAKASTVSYLRRYTLLGAIGMAAGMPDADGKQAPARLMGAELYSAHMKLIKEAKAVPELVQFRNNALSDARKAKDSKSEKLLDEAARTRKAAITGGAA